MKVKDARILFNKTEVDGTLRISDFKVVEFKAGQGTDSQAKPTKITYVT